MKLFIFFLQYPETFVISIHLIFFMQSIVNVALNFFQTTNE